MAAFGMLGYWIYGYQWGITHNKLQFVVYWLMSIVNMVQDGGKTNISRSGYAYMCAYVLICL